MSSQSTPSLDVSLRRPPRQASVQVGRGSPTLPRALAELAEIQFRLGDWGAAYSSAKDAVWTARAGCLGDEIRRGLARMALIEAGLGRADACRAHAEAALGERDSRLVERDRRLVEALAGEALGFLELGLGRIDAAIERLETVALICGTDPRANAITVTWTLDLADARLRRGDRVGARRALGRLDERARRSGSWVLVAASERCRAELAPADAFDSRFHRALAWSVRARQPFERARTELRFGERLRRARRPREARVHLGAALDGFERVGARPWADAASRELAAA